jgi:hypothetical protein
MEMIFMSVYSMKSDMTLEKDGSRLLMVCEFTFEGVFYKPAEPVKFLITEEPEGWLFIRDDSIGIRSGGDDLEEAIMKGLFITADRYNRVVATPDENLDDKVLQIKEKYLKWEVHAIDQQAQ